MATRRRVIRSLGGLALLGSAGCLDGISGDDSSSDDDGSGNGQDSEDVQAQLESARDRIEELEEELARTETSLVFEKYVYGYSLSLDADERYSNAVSAWDDGDFITVHSRAERAWGIYSASAAAFEECRQAVQENDAVSAEPAVADAVEYAGTMTEASAALSTAAEDAIADEHARADESRKTAQERAETARGLSPLPPSEFQELIGE